MPQLEAIERDEVVRHGDQSLARAYVTDFDRVAEFYNRADWRNMESLVERVPVALAGGPDDEGRAALAAKLVRYLRSLDAPEASVKAAESLRLDGTVVIVTGQQPSLGGGPLMVLHKVAHAIRLAQSLQAQGVDAVPVFLVASEDHDIAEVNHFGAIGESGKFVDLKLDAYHESGVAPLEVLSPVPEDRTWSKIAALIRQSAKLASDPHLAEQALLLLDMCKEETLGRACAKLMLSVFPESGLVVVESHVLRGLPGSNAVLEREFRSAPTSQRGEVLNPRVRIAKAGYSLSLDEPPDCLYYLLHGGLRHRVKRIGGRFAAGPWVRSRSSDQLVASLTRTPGQFSTSVRLRPVVQGACLPVLAYVGGPSEIAYHAELRDLFAWHRIPMPVLIPRWSFVLADPSDDPGAMRKRAIEVEESASRAAAAGAEYLNEVRGLLVELRSTLGPIAPSVESDVVQISGRAEKAIRELSGRIKANPLRESGASEAIILQNARLFPQSQPQERLLSWLAVWPRDGTKLLRAYAERDPIDACVRVVR